MSHQLLELQNLRVQDRKINIDQFYCFETSQGSMFVQKSGVLYSYTIPYNCISANLCGGGCGTANQNAFYCHAYQEVLGSNLEKVARQRALSFQRFTTFQCVFTSFKKCLRCVVVGNHRPMDGN